MYPNLMLTHIVNVFFCKDFIRLFVCLFGAEEERMSSWLHTKCRAQRGGSVSQPWDHDPELKTWAETKIQTLNQLSHPGTPHKFWVLTWTEVKLLKKEGIRSGKMSHITFNIATSEVSCQCDSWTWQLLLMQSWEASPNVGVSVSPLVKPA